MPKTDAHSTTPTGPLAGVRVLELAQIMAGPTCGLMLADMGADVIKIEKLPKGDDSRGYQDPQINGVSAPFLILNRNKRGMGLDLKNPKGARCGVRRAQDGESRVDLCGCVGLRTHRAAGRQRWV